MISFPLRPRRANAAARPDLSGVSVHWPASINRRTLMAFVAVVAMLGLASVPEVRAGEQLKLGLLEFGTASWVAETITGEKLDAAGGFQLTPVMLASNEAARIAFQAGDVDVIVSDLLFAGRSTAEGRPLVFVPFSASEGSLMVAANSPVKTLADLKGRKIGVAGGPLDKGWLLLRAEASRSAGFDPQTAAEPVFGAPPLIQRKLETGEIDAALIFWNFAARLEAQGYRSVIGVGDLARGFGVKGDVAMIGYIFRKDFADRNPALTDAFVAAHKQAGQKLAMNEASWTRIRPLTRAPDDATFSALKQRFLAGQPKRPLAEEEADARRLWEALAQVGGKELVGTATSLPDGVYRKERNGGS